jgi:hypothetical protein
VFRDLSGRVCAALAAALAVIVLAGCALADRPSQGVEWAVWQEQERQRLQAQGFPQYSWP